MVKSYLSKDQLLDFKTILEARKLEITENLGTIGHKDPKNEFNYDATYIDYGSDMESNAVETAEYENNLSLEYTLESSLAKVNDALDRIAKGSYGMCKKCGSEIPVERLRIMPSADTCMSCKNADKPVLKR